MEDCVGDVEELSRRERRWVYESRIRQSEVDVVRRALDVVATAKKRLHSYTTSSSASRVVEAAWAVRRVVRSEVPLSAALRLGEGRGERVVVVVGLHFELGSVVWCRTLASNSRDFIGSSKSLVTVATVSLFPTSNKSISNQVEVNISLLFVL